jgi:hypothetical protein
MLENELIIKNIKKISQSKEASYSLSETDLSFIVTQRFLER